MENDEALDPPCVVCAKPAGRPKASEVEARAQSLLDTAGRLFLMHGYSKVSLESIAREARVAVRTIYVKFGGKAGLFNAVLESRRDAYFNTHDMHTDERPLRELVTDFAHHFLYMITSVEALRIQRMVIAEATTSPELAQTFFTAGPVATREMLARYFARPDVRVQLRDDVAPELLPVFLLNCITGDQFKRFLFEPTAEERKEASRKLEQRLELFFRAVLRQP